MHADSQPGTAESPRPPEPECSPKLATAEANFAAAKELCRTGHRDDEGTTCTYGGMAAANGYWLFAESCELNHGETCDLRAVCDGAPAETGFHGRNGMVLVDDWIWRVDACQPCADLYVAAHPEWVRKPPAQPVPHEEWMRQLREAADAQLAALTPEQREYVDMTTNLMLYGQHPAPETPPTYAGFFGLDDPVEFPRPVAEVTRRFPAPRPIGKIGALRWPLYVSPPEPVPVSRWTGPSSWLAIADEAAERQWPTHTLTDDPQPPLTRAAAVVADLARANALLALCFTGRNAFDARIRFLRQMEELTTSPGVSAGELEAIRRGLLDLAEGRAPKAAAAPQADTGPFTHTFTFSPRESCKSEALRKAQAEHAENQDTL